MRTNHPVPKDFGAYTAENEPPSFKSKHLILFFGKY